MKKRIIAFVLSAIMVLSTVYPVQNVWADPDAEPEKQNETQVEVVTEQPGAESNQEQQASAPTEKETEAPAPQSTEVPAPQQTQPPVTEPAPTEQQTEASDPTEKEPEMTEPEEQQTEASAPTEKEPEVTEPEEPHTEAPVPAETTEAPAPTEEQTEAPAPTEEQTETPVETTEPKTEDPTLPDIGVPEIPAESWKELTNAEKDVVVSGVLPVGTVLNGGSIPNPFLMGKNANALKGGRKSTNSSSSRGTDGIANWNYIAFYDLKLAADGENVQPDGSVQVTITNVAVKGKNVSILHILDNAEAITKNIANLTKVTDSSFVSAFPTEAAAAKAATGEEGCVYIELLDATVNGESVTFTTGSFSIFVIVDEGQDTTPRRTFYFLDEKSGSTGTELQYEPYYFYDKSGDLVDNQILKNGESLEAVITPDSSSTKLFVGWYYVTYDEATGTVSNWGNSVSFGTPFNDITTDSVVYVAAAYGDACFVSFHESFWGHTTTSGQQVYKNVITKKRVRIDETNGGTVRVGDVTAQALVSGKVFVGWEQRDASGNVIGTAVRTVDANGNQLTDASISGIRGNIDLYPIYDDAKYIRFVAGPTGSGAVYVPAKFVVATTDLSTLPTTTREGYTFKGWYTGSMTDNVITYGTQITDENGNVLDQAGLRTMLNNAASDITLYAKWEANSSTHYTIYVWKQSVNDAKDAADADKTYDWTATYVIDNMTPDTNLPATLDAIRTAINNDPKYNGVSLSFTGFKVTPRITRILNGRENNTIDAAGKSIVNVYFDRELLTINFKANDGTINYYEATTSNSGTQYGYVNDELVELTKNDQGEWVIRGVVRTTEYEGYRYAVTNNSSNTNVTHYAFVNGQYVALSQKAHTVYQYYIPRQGGCSTNYDYDEVFYDANHRDTGYSGTNLPPEDDNTTYYGLYNGSYYALSKRATSTTYTYQLNGTDYTETQYIRVTNNTGTQYGVVDGVQKTLTYADGVWYYDYTEEYADVPYTGIRFEQKSSTSDVTFTGLYGQTLYQNGYLWPNGHTWTTNSNGGGRTLVFLDAFIFDGLTSYNVQWAEGHITKNEITLYRRNSDTGAFVYFYTEKLDGTWYLAQTIESDGGNFTITDKFTGFSAYEYRSGTTGTWNTLVGTKNSDGEYNNGQSISYNATTPLYIHFARNKYPLTFISNGTTVLTYDGNNKIPYQKPLNGYQPTGYVVGETQATINGVPCTFEGWYDNADGQGTPINFATATMPLEGLILYAKWEPIWLLVKLELDYGDLGQGTAGRTYTWIQYGKEFTPYQITRNYIDVGEGNGHYEYVTSTYDGYLAGTNAQYNGQPLTEDDIWDLYGELDRSAYYQEQSGGRYDYQEGAYTLIGWFKVENGVVSNEPYDADSEVVAPMTLRARWKRVGSFDVMYRGDSVVTVDGVQVAVAGDLDVYTDEGYADNATAIIMTEPTSVTPGYVFEGWQIVNYYFDATLPEGVSRVVYSTSLLHKGDEFTIDSNQAVNNVIHLEPVFSKVEQSDQPVPITFIKLNANADDATVTGLTSGSTVAIVEDASADDSKTYATITISGNQVEFAALQINEEFDLELFKDNFVREGFVLLGWNHVKSEADAGLVEFTPAAIVGADNLADTSNTLYAVWGRVIKVTKVWADDNDRDGKRPESVTVTLVENGINSTRTDAVQVLDDSSEKDENGNWTYAWIGLPVVDASGNEITYSVVETRDSVITGTNGPGTYAESYSGNMVNGLIVTNTHTPETIQLKVVKDWADDNNRDGKRPTSLDVTLKKGEEELGTTTLNDGNSWTYTTPSLYKYENGAEITYTWIEAALPEGYTQTNTASETSEDGKTVTTTITNSYTPEKIDIPVSKVWADGENRDGIRPDSVTAILRFTDPTQSENQIELTKVLSESNNWEDSWTGLYRYMRVNNTTTEIVYTVDEKVEGVIKGTADTDDAEGSYKYAVSGDKTNGFVITNTHEPEKITVTVSKEWSDGDNQDGIRPSAVVVTLDGLSGDQAKGGAAEVDNVASLDASNNWTYTWDGLDHKGLYKYENGVLIDYTVSENLGNVTVVRDGENVTVALTDNNNGRNAYKATVDGGRDEETGNFVYTVTNEHVPETTQVTVTKKWDDDNDRDGARPEELTYNLTGKVGETKVVEDSKTVNVDPDTGAATHTFDNLPRYNNGKEIVYSVSEDEITVDEKYQSGYSSTVGEMAATTADDGTVSYTVEVTNRHIPDKVEVEVTKIWDDNNDQDGKRPEKLIINLFADTTKIDSKEIAKDNTVNQQSVTFTTTTGENAVTLYKYHDGGELINYTVTEEEVKYYVNGTPVLVENSEYGYTITNVHTPMTTSVTVSKTWDDNNNQDNVRPSGVTIRLYRTEANGGLTEIDSVTLNEANNWTHTFSNLTSYRDHGVVIVYTVQEDEVPLYSTEFTQTSWTAITDPDDANEGNIKWSDVEFINTHGIIKTEVPVKKVWNDDNDRDGIRPESLTVQLYADGELVKDAQNKPVEITLNEGNNWSGKFTGLDAYKNGQLITYTVKEVYTEVLTESTDSASTYKLDAANTSMGQATVDQTTKEVTWSEAVITNVHTPETVEITITKIWVDNSNSGNTRPENFLALLHLFANGTEIPQVNMMVVKSETGDTWTYTFKGTAEYPLYKYTAKRQEITYKFEEDEIKKNGTVVYGAAWNPQEIASTDDLSKFKVTNTALEGELVIAKQFTNNATFTDDQSFVFHVTGPSGATTVDRTVVVVVKAGKSYGYVTITQIPIGTYTVTEDDDWSWRWEANATTPLTANNVKDGKPEVLPTQTTTVIFNNDLTDENWLSDTAYARNIFTGASGSTGSALPAPEEPKSVAMVLPATEVEDDKKKREEA